eukprot:2607585-Prymnesium_polylepis.1
MSGLTRRRRRRETTQRNRRWPSLCRTRRSEVQPTQSQLVKMPVWRGQTERAHFPPAAPLTTPSMSTPATTSS